MLNQGTYNQGTEYQTIAKENIAPLGYPTARFVGFICGAPVFKKFSMEDVRPFDSIHYLSQFVVAGPQPANQMGAVKI